MLNNINKIRNEVDNAADEVEILKINHKN